jgi:hypothetical protein
MGRFAANDQSARYFNMQASFRGYNLAVSNLKNIFTN